MTTPSPTPIIPRDRAPAPRGRPPAPPTGPLIEAPGGREPTRVYPPVVLRRPLARADWVAAAGTGAAVAAGAGLVAFYLAALWRARDPR